jgi:tetratricopeptide (TPR) repeat protein
VIPVKIYQSDETSLPLGKLILGTTLAITVLIAGFQLYASFQADKRVDELMATARDHIRLEHPEQALRAVEQALQLKEKPEALDLKAEILMNQNRVYAADSVLKRLIELEPDNAQYRYRAALAALNEEDTAKGVEHLQKAVALEPQNADYAVAMANMLFKDGKTEEARKTYEELIRKDPNYKHGWEQYQIAFSNAGRYDEAVAIGKRAIQQFPEDSDFHFLLASTLDHMGKRPEAVSAYRRSLELEPMESSIAATRIFEITGKHVPLRLENLAADSVPFDSENKLMYVSATVNGHHGRFLLDTGASVSVIFQSRAEQYALTSSPLKVAVQTANGIIQVPVTYGSIRLGRKKMDQVVLAVIPDPKRLDADGIIGMNYLGNMRMDVDRNAQRIVLAN